MTIRSPFVPLPVVTKAIPTFEEESLISATELLFGVVVPAILNRPFLPFDTSGTKPATTAAVSSVPISKVVDEPNTSN